MQQLTSSQRESVVCPSSSRLKQNMLGHILGKARALELLKTESLKFPPPSGQSSVHIPYPFVGFVCQMPLLKNNLRRLLSSLINFVYKHANTRLVTLCMMLPFTKTQL